MLRNFKTYQLALQFHRSCEQFKVPPILREQLSRSSSSVVLNIAEGSGKITFKDRRKFFAIALGSLRESMANLEMSGNIISSELMALADQLGACLYRLCLPK